MISSIIYDGDVQKDGRGLALGYRLDDTKGEWQFVNVNQLQRARASCALLFSGCLTVWFQQTWLRRQIVLNLCVSIAFYYQPHIIKYKLYEYRNNSPAV